MVDLRRLARATGVASGAAGVAALAAGGELLAAAVALVLGAVLAVAVRTWTAPEHRGTVGALVALAYGGRVLLLAVTHLVLLAAGTGGHLLGDDATYADAAWRYALFLRGEPTFISWVGERYIFSPFVQAEAALFALIGPQVAVPKMANAFLGSALVLVVHRIAAPLVGGRAAAVAAGLAAFFPSLVLWSVLNLKDIPAVFFSAVSVLAIVLVATSPVRALALFAASLAALAAVRDAAALLLAAILPVALFVHPPRAGRWALTASAVALSVASAAAIVGASTGLGPQDVEIRRSFSAQSHATAASEFGGVGEPDREGVRTAFVPQPDAYRPPLVVRPGDRVLVFDLALEDPSVRKVWAGPPPLPVSGRTIVAEPGTYLQLTRGATTRPRDGAVLVSGGDIVVVAGAPPDERRAPAVLALREGADEARQLVLKEAGGDAVAAVVRLLGSLPRGLVYVVAAPFPWTAERLRDLVTVPEMLVWYVTVVAAAIGSWRARSRWATVFPVLAYVAGTALALAAVEGNTGTLFRHRSMIYPFVFVLAAPVLLGWADHVRARLARPGSA